MTAVKEKAYAKINLFLDVTKKREDGFHDIKTVMHNVSLNDEVVVSVMPSRVMSVKLLVKGSRFLPTDNKNLAVRAANLFYEKIGKVAAVKIVLKKRIPISAGLAGGSSDAAAVLRALNKIYKKPFTDKALCDIGAALGSDIPYCIMGKTAVCEGRGELITPISSDLKLFCVIAVGNEHVSTPTAYGALDALYNNFDGTAKTDGVGIFEALLMDIKESRTENLHTFNIFESAVLPQCPKAAYLKKKMTELGANVSLMSGSGPSVFGVFSNMKKAAKAASILSEEGFFATATTSV